MKFTASVIWRANERAREERARSRRKTCGVNWLSGWTG
jgi:hypothetical protein